MMRPHTSDMDADKVFKALGDAARQSVTQHLGLLEEADLVTVVWKGREKLHFINPVPLHEVYARWVRKFERQRLDLLHDLKSELEGKRP